jgi:hypothetical protein
MRRGQRCREAREPPPSVGPGGAKEPPGVISAPQRDKPGPSRRGQGLRARCLFRSDWNGSPLRPSTIPIWRAPHSPSIERWRCENGPSAASPRPAPRAWTGSHGVSTRRPCKHPERPDTSNSSTTRPVRHQSFAVCSLRATGSSDRWGSQPWRTSAWPRPSRCCWKRLTRRLSTTSPTVFARAAIHIRPGRRSGRGCWAAGWDR